MDTFTACALLEPPTLSLCPQICYNMRKKEGISTNKLLPRSSREESSTSLQQARLQAGFDSSTRTPTIRTRALEQIDKFHSIYSEPNSANISSTISEQLQNDAANQRLHTHLPSSIFQRSKLEKESNDSSQPTSYRNRSTKTKRLLISPCSKQTISRAISSETVSQLAHNQARLAPWAPQQH